MENKYAHRSRISEAKFRQLIRCFVLDLDAYQAAAMTGLNRNTVNRYLRLIRQRLAQFCEAQSPFAGEIEVDESYFGARRIKGKRGRGAGGKTPVFGIFQRSGKVYTEVIPDCAKATLQAIIRGKVALESVIHSDGWRAYDGLVDLGYQKHFRVQHGQNEFVRGRCHINGIESFWSFAKRRLAKFHGVPAKTFYLHLKECEFRFNSREDDAYALILKIVREKPLS
jgi:transposase-like protein